MLSAEAKSQEYEVSLAADAYAHFKHLLLPITDRNPYLFGGTRQLFGLAYHIGLANCRGRRIPKQLLRRREEHQDFPPFYCKREAPEMSEDDSISKQNRLDLLNEFELVLELDPLIDEVGFIHPSQFVTLNKESSGKTSTLDCEENQHFWNKDHKLGISSQILMPLYSAAKHAFFSAIKQYEKFNSLENEVMKHSKAVLLLSSDFRTVWNSRKLIVSKKQDLAMFIDELLFSALVLSCSPKSEQAWCHRRWVIKMIAGKCSTLQEIVGKESELVEKIAERSKMNYRAWNHRCWLVSYMTREQVLHELKKSRNWAGLHVADSSCFHYRTRLTLKILEEPCHKQEDESSDHSDEIYQIWREELDWNETLIKRYIGREALWLYRRFLSLCWLRHFATNPSSISHHSEPKCNVVADVNIFVDNELHLINSCSTVPDNDFEDFQAQAIYSTTYVLWLTKHISESPGIQLQEKLNAESLKIVLNAACPERSSLWSILTGYLGMADQGLK